MGVCFFDEGFYLVVARSIMTWGRPFVMSATLAQTFSAMLIPFMQLWYLLGMSDEGLVLWMRVVYLITNCACLALLYNYARTRLDAARSLLVSLLAIVWIPYGIPALSYYTLGANAFLCGLLLYCLSTNSKARNVDIGIADTLFVIACLAYPPLALPCLVFLLSNIRFAEDADARRRGINSIVRLVSVGMALLILTALLCGAQNLMRTISLVGSGAGFYRSDMLGVTCLEFADKLYPLIFICTLAASAATIVRKNAMVLLCGTLGIVAALIVTACLKSEIMPAQSHVEVLLLSIYLIPTVSLREGVPIKSKIAFFSSIFAGFVFTITSGNGPMAFAIGAYPGVCFGMCEFVRQQGEGRPKMFSTVSVVVCVASILVLFHSAFTAIYGDRDLDWKHTERVSSGPYRWLRTTPSKKLIVTQLADDLRLLCHNRSTLYIIGPPGWYLCSTLKSLDLTFWHASRIQSSPSARSTFSSFYRSAGYPDLIVVASDPVFGTPSGFDLEMLKENYVAVLGRPGYKVLLRSPVTR
jgi:hypothetical protein